MHTASGDLRNLVRTVNGLPHDYEGKLTVLLNDRDPFVIMRNISLLMILGTIADRRKAVDTALHFWYSAFIPNEYHSELLLIVTSIMTVTAPGPLKVSLGDKAGLEADVGKDMRMLCEAISMSSQFYSTSDAANELARIRLVAYYIARPCGLIHES